MRTADLVLVRLPSSPADPQAPASPALLAGLGLAGVTIGCVAGQPQLSAIAWFLIATGTTILILAAAGGVATRDRRDTLRVKLLPDGIEVTGSVWAHRLTALAPSTLVIGIFGLWTVPQGHPGTRLTLTLLMLAILVWAAAIAIRRGALIGHPHSIVMTKEAIRFRDDRGVFETGWDQLTPATLTSGKIVVATRRQMRSIDTYELRSDPRLVVELINYFWTETDPRAELGQESAINRIRSWTWRAET